MIKLLFVLVLASYELLAFFDQTRYINGEYKNNLKIIWLHNKSDNTADNIQVKFSLALNDSVKKLYNKYGYEHISNTEMKNYSSISSIIDEPSIYTDKQKLFDALDDQLNAKYDDQLVVLLRIVKLEGNGYKIFGAKLFKDGKENIASTYEINYKGKNLTQKHLNNMTYFFIKSSINDFEAINRSGVDPIITFKDDIGGELEIETFKAIDIKKHTAKIENVDFEEAYKLGLISSDKPSPQVAHEYCEMLGLMLINKNLLTSDEFENEYTYEQLFEKVSFQDGWEVYGKTKYLEYDKRDFRCVEAKDSILKYNLNEYEQNEIGLFLKLNNKNVIHKDEIRAVDIVVEKSFSGDDKLYIAMIDEIGMLSIWENDEYLVGKNIHLKNAKRLELEEDLSTINIETLTKKSVLKNESGTIEEETTRNHQDYIQNGIFIVDKDSSTYVDIQNNLVKLDGTKTELEYSPTSLKRYIGGISIGTKDAVYTYLNGTEEPIKHIGIDGYVNKIIYFKDDKYFVVSTSTSKLIVFKAGESKPIKTISNFGYSFVDISISSDQKYLVAANGDQMVYVFDLDVILNSTITNKEEVK
ncbi:MAG: hypothetical protein U9O56_06995 [Campylobacterota bacterium]|nr:hypothetical protein [Campylobacterota bacterium]